MTVAQAADPGVSSSLSPAWHHKAVSRLDQSRPGPAAAAEAGPQKYLHIEMQINDPSVLQNRDKFRIVDGRGNEVDGSENWGYNDEKKLLIFEGRWGSLVGLYLDGFGHREPLFDQVALPGCPSRSGGHASGGSSERIFLRQRLSVTRMWLNHDRTFTSTVATTLWSTMMSYMTVLIATWSYTMASMTITSSSFTIGPIVTIPASCMLAVAVAAVA